MAYLQHCWRRASSRGRRGAASFQLPIVAQKAPIDPVLTQFVPIGGSTCEHAQSPDFRFRDVDFASQAEPWGRPGSNRFESCEHARTVPLSVLCSIDTMKKTPPTANIQITTDGPYLVNGGLPLS